jgi:hypothetical protein
MFTAPTDGTACSSRIVARYQGKVSRIYFRADAGIDAVSLGFCGAVEANSQQNLDKVE